MVPAKAKAKGKGNAGKAKGRSKTPGARKMSKATTKRSVAPSKAKSVASTTKPTPVTVSVKPSQAPSRSVAAKATSLPATSVPAQAAAGAATPGAKEAWSQGPAKAPPPEYLRSNYKVEKVVEEHFKQIDNNNSGRLSRAELYEAMMNVTGTYFSKETINMLFGMFDTDETGGLDLVEFQQLYDFMNEWTQTFWRLDARKRGYIVYHELLKALSMLGYRLDSHCVKVLTRKFGRTAKFLELDNFIRICCLLKRLTDTFKQKDKKAKGCLTLHYYDVLHMSLTSCF